MRFTIRVGWHCLLLPLLGACSAEASDDSVELGEGADSAVVESASSSRLQSCTPSFSRECTAWATLRCLEPGPGGTCGRWQYYRTCQDYTQTYDCRPYYGPMVTEYKNG